MKRAPKKKTKAPGANIEEWQRKTIKVQLRVHSLVAATIQQRADAMGIDRSEYVSQLVMADLNGKSVDWRPSDE